MAEQFYTIPTAIGKAKIANSIALGTKINLKTMKIGDSNGSYYNPNESQTDLVHPVYSCNINSVDVDEDNANWINIICAIPADIGDFYIREAGAFDDTGALIAIGKYPETYKPIATNGSTKEIYIKMTLEVTSTSSIELKIDPTVVLATKKDIDILTNSINSITTQLSENTQDISNLKTSKADNTDSNRTTTDKTVTGAINELNSVKASKTQENWIAPTLLNGWVNIGGVFDNTGYFKDSIGMVHLRGLLKSGTTNTNTVIFALPVGYKPLGSNAYSVYSNDGAVVGTVQVTSDGYIKIISGGNISLSLSGIIYKAEQ